MNVFSLRHFNMQLFSFLNFKIEFDLIREFLQMKNLYLQICHEIDRVHTIDCFFKEVFLYAHCL